MLKAIFLKNITENPQIVVVVKLLFFFLLTLGARLSWCQEKEFKLFKEVKKEVQQEVKKEETVQETTPEAHDKGKKVEVILGIDVIEKLSFTPSTNVQVGNESVVTYQIIPTKREITFKGVKPGKTSIIVRNSVGDIKARFLVTVTANDHSVVIKDIKAYLGDIEGIDIGIKGERVYVGGKIIVPGDIGLINTILKKYSDVLQLVELHPQSQRLVSRKMQDEIQKNDLPDVTVRVVNKMYWLEGVVRSNGELQRAEQIAIAYVPDRILTLAEREDSVQKARKPIIQNFIVVNPSKRKPAPLEKLVKITAQFVELVKDYTRIFGFKWTPVLAGTGGSIRFGKFNNAGVVTKSNSTLSGVISNLFPKLGMAKSAGFARVIQSGIIIVKNGVEGSIRKEALERFAIGTTEFVKSEQAKAGFNLIVKPSIIKDEQIDLTLGIGVSVNVGTPPRTLSNEIKTNLIVKSKESAVVGGIAINRSATDYDKTPPGGQDRFEGGGPLFSFLRSKSYVKGKSQFVVFVTPEIIESASDGTSEIQRKFRKRGR